ncbi:universal stress protein [Haloarchaeobius amylolyticus]|uniref:universal stress protein n=1 Tax=Haloarchaeobius amylolyticus TaxID=1198296 RepID=UPI0022722313|nr:universal stress protein [Haloarchaeobius amylolyticus]
MSNAHHALVVRTDGKIADGIVELAVELAGDGLPPGFEPTIEVVAADQQETFPAETARHTASTALHVRELVDDSVTVEWHTVEAETPADALETTATAEEPGIVVVSDDLGAAVAESVFEATGATVVLAPNDWRLDRVETVLGAVGTGPYGGSVAETVGALAHIAAADAELAHVGDEDGLLDAAAACVDDVPLETRLLSGTVHEALSDAASDADALVIGGPSHDHLRQLAFGSTSRRLREESDTLTLTVWAADDSLRGDH